MEQMVSYPTSQPHARFDTTCYIHDLASHPIHDSTPSVPYTTSHPTPFTIPHHLFHTRPRISPIYTIPHHMFHTRPLISPHSRFDTTCSIHDLASHPIHDSTPPVPYTTSHLTPYMIRHHLFHTRPRTPPHTRFHTICSILDLASHPIHDSIPSVPYTTSHPTPIHDSTPPVPYTTSHLSPIHDSTPSVPYTTSHPTPYTIRHHMFYSRLSTSLLTMHELTYLATWL
jgi:hypothetical protein